MAGRVTRPATKVATYIMTEGTPRATKTILDRGGGMSWWSKTAVFFVEKLFQSNPFWPIGSGFVAWIFGDLSKIGCFLGGH